MITFFYFAMLCLVLPFMGLDVLKAASVILVDYGSSPGTTVFGLPGWSTPLKSNNVNYTAQGGGGLIVSSDPGEYGDYRGVQGTPRRFSRGERIVVTWYNDSEEMFFFTSRISFTDEDEPDELTPEGNWYTMRSFNDYRNTYSEIMPHGSAKTVFNITDSGVHKTDGTYSLVNINLAIEWGSTYQKQFLICDKIELLDDADVTPPGQPTGLVATAVSDSKIRLNWNAPPDNVGVAEYLIYMNGTVEGYSQSNDHTSVYLEPNKEYTFSVTALDAAGNESVPSAPASARTLPYGDRGALINPAGFEYLGAIVLPEIYGWGGEAIAYNPNGNGGQANSSDNYPGSLFVTNLNQPENGLVGEINIPSPVISPGKNLAELNESATLTPPVNIRPANVNAWEYVDIWRTGLEVIPEEGRLYSAWSIHYTVTGEKHASISCCEASNLSGSTKYGAWYVGRHDEPPIDAMMNDWLFSVPQDWADANCSGMNLVVGRCRDGGLSGLGPTMYAFSKVGVTPPPANQALAFTTLLQYGPVEGTDNVHFPNAVDGYNHADEWREARWISAGNQQAVAIVGNKALGHNWYGYHGERMRHDWVIADVPYPDFWETDPDGKGWRAHTRQPMIIFYDPADLAAVARGVLSSHDPQPYAALRISNGIFFGANHEIFSAAFDSKNQILYVTEFVRDLEGRLLLHAWKVNPVSTSVQVEEHTPADFMLEQNYPNPFNSETVIAYQLPRASEVEISIFNLQGKRVTTLAKGHPSAGYHKITWNGREKTGRPAASGSYLYQLKAGNFVAVKKMLLLR